MLSFSVQQIADLVQGQVEGNADLRIHTFGKIETAQEGAITFLSNPKYESFLYTTQASAVLLATTYTLQKAITPTIIRVKDPYTALATLLKTYEKMGQSPLKGIHKKAIVLSKKNIPKSVFIGAGAVIEEGVSLGEQVVIYPLCYVGKNVSIGSGTILYPNVVIYEHCIIGRQCIIHAGAVIGADGFGFAPQEDGTYEKIPQLGNVVIEDNVEVGANTCIDRATMGHTLIRQGVKIDNLVQIGHNVEIDTTTVIAGQAGIAGSVTVGRQCVIAGQVGISGHLKIGDKVTIGPQAGLIGSVKNGTNVWGTPSMESRQFMKSSVIFRNLPDLEKRVQALEKILSEKNVDKS